jgi:hypothetical protein
VVHCLIWLNEFILQRVIEDGMLGGWQSVARATEQLARHERRS